MRIVIKKKGLVLVGVLWLVIILTVVISTTGRSSRLDTKVTMSRIEEIRCKWAGRGGVEKALALFNEDDTEADCLTDIWSNNPEEIIFGNKEGFPASPFRTDDRAAETK